MSAKTDLHNGTATVVGKDMEKAAVQEIDGPARTSRSEIDDLLDKIMVDEQDGKKNIIATCDFSLSNKGKAVGGHAFTIKSVTEDEVILISPWSPSDEIVMSREDFAAATTGVQVSDLDNNKPLEHVETTTKNTSEKQKNSSHSHEEKPVTPEEKKQITNLIHNNFKK